MFSIWHWHIIVVLADGPAEDLYGMFINRVRRERPPELLEEIKGWVSNSSWSLSLVCILGFLDIFLLSFNCFLLNNAGLQSGCRLPLRWQEVTLRIISIDLGRGWMLLHWTCCSSTGMFIAHKVTIAVIIFVCHFLSMTSSMLEATAEIWEWFCKWL